MEQPGLLASPSRMILFMIILSACSQLHEAKEAAFGEMVTLEEANTKITLTLDAGMNTLKQGTEIKLLLVNRSDSYLWFADDYGIRVFVFSDSEQVWFEFPNEASQYEQSHILPPSSGKGFLDARLLAIYPKLPESDQPVTMRILVEGYTYEHDAPTQDKVHAYIDVTLRP